MYDWSRLEVPGQNAVNNKNDLLSGRRRSCHGVEVKMKPVRMSVKTICEYTFLRFEDFSKQFCGYWLKMQLRFLEVNLKYFFFTPTKNNRCCWCTCPGSISALVVLLHWCICNLHVKCNMHMVESGHVHTRPGSSAYKVASSLNSQLEQIQA